MAEIGRSRKRSGTRGLERPSDFRGDRLPHRSDVKLGNQVFGHQPALVVPDRAAVMPMTDLGSGPIAEHVILIGTAMLFPAIGHELEQGLPLALSRARNRLPREGPDAVDIVAVD